MHCMMMKVSCPIPHLLVGDDDDDNDFINDIQAENKHLLQTLSSSYDQHLQPLSPVCITTKLDETTTTNIRPLVDGTDKVNRSFIRDYRHSDLSFQVSVTLTLTTEAANNVQSVMAAVADLLKMAYPTTIDVHQTLNQCACVSNVNNSHSKDVLSLPSEPSISPHMNRAGSIYKTGRETSVSIQTMIDTQPKYCRNCSQNLIMDNLLKKRLTEVPVHLRESTPNAEPFVYFCHEQCFTSYAQQSFTTNIKSEPMEVMTLSVPIKRQEQVDWKELFGEKVILCVVDE